MKVKTWSGYDYIYVALFRLQRNVQPFVVLSVKYYVRSLSPSGQHYSHSTTEMAEPCSKPSNKNHKKTSNDTCWMVSLLVILTSNSTFSFWLYNVQWNPSISKSWNEDTSVIGTLAYRCPNTSQRHLNEDTQDMIFGPKRSWVPINFTSNFCRQCVTVVGMLIKFCIAVLFSHCASRR